MSTNADIKVPEVAEEPVEVRVYQTKCTKKLANGESKVYLTEHCYLPKKKPGMCKTELRRQHSMLRTTIKNRLRDMPMDQLQQVADLCNRLNSNLAEIQPTA